MHCSVCWQQSSHSGCIAAVAKLVLLLRPDLKGCCWHPLLVAIELALCTVEVATAPHQQLAADAVAAAGCGCCDTWRCRLWAWHEAHLQAIVDHLARQHAGCGGAISSRVVGAASNLHRSWQHSTTTTAGLATHACTVRDTSRGTVFEKRYVHSFPRCKEV